jgi:multidrug efflux pump
MAATVAAPLERKLGTISGVDQITSTSSLGSTSIQVQFAICRDIDRAARDVQAAINASLADLPSDLPTLPSSSASPIRPRRRCSMLALTSTRSRQRDV